MVLKWLNAIKIQKLEIHFHTFIRIIPATRISQEHGRTSSRLVPSSPCRR